MKDFEKSIMRGEFRGDFTRDTFKPEKTYSRVLMQQGRVQLDADSNEQVSILLHHIRSLACDIGSEHWGPGPAGSDEAGGFEIAVVTIDDFTIGIGHYYVNGILCEVGAGVTYNHQPDYPLSDETELNKFRTQQVLVYLDVWERHISFIEDDSIREVALGGPDTASRAKIVWQVKVIAPERNISTEDEIHPFKRVYATFLQAIAGEIKTGTGKLQARAKDKSKTDTEPCLAAPESRYRGLENQLYRVEIHNKRGNTPGTFKWSRENAAVIFPILERVDSNVGSNLSLEHLGRDDRFFLKPNDWVEVVDDDYILQNRAENLLQIMTIDQENLKVTLKGLAESDVGKSTEKHPYLRRWDQKTGDANGILVQESTEDDEIWIDLEEGIQIRFPASDAGTALNNYQSGDYWLIPARTITGDVEWPAEQNGKPKALLPHGVIHHYAPLAIISIGADGNISKQAAIDLRRIIRQNWE